MAKSKGGCLGMILMVGSFVALCCVCIPLFKKLTMEGIGNFCFVGGIIAVIALIACLVMALVYKKPEFEDESFGHACMRWLFGALGACALGAAFFFFLGPSQMKSLATDAKKDASSTTQEVASPAAEQSTTEAK